MQQTWRPALRLPWILDLDVTVKPIYGQQEGAAVGYNPHQPGRPSHTYHTLFVRGLRLVLDVEVRSGQEHSATHSRENLWRVWDTLPRECRPWLLCGDASYGHEGLLAECETRGQKYLFRLRQSPGVKQLVRLLESQGGWRAAGQGYAGAEGQLQLHGLDGQTARDRAAPPARAPGRRATPGQRRPRCRGRRSRCAAPRPSTNTRCWRPTWAKRS